MNATVDIEYQDYAQAFSDFIRERGALLPKALRGDLIRPTLLDQAYHGMSFSHAIVGGILRQNHSRNDNDTMSVLVSEGASFIDDTQALRVVSLWK